jgi:cyclase
MRRMMVATATATALATALVLAASVAGAQGRDWSKVEIRTQKLAEGIYMLTGAGGNMGVSVGEDGIALIDDQYAPLTPRIQAALAALSDKPARFVINTHYHGDHTGGNENFGKAGAVIVAHDNVRRRLAAGKLAELGHDATPPAPKAALPVVTFTADVTLHYNGQELRVTHMARSHTDGDAVIEFHGANVIHMGDIFFNGFYPFIDVDSGGHVDGVIATADRVMAMANDETKIIPGHGKLASRADLQRYRNMLAALRTSIGKLIAEGKSLEEVLAATPTKDFDPAWGTGGRTPAQITTAIYNSLKPRQDPS